MLKDRLDRLVDFPGLLERAEHVFEQKSGWKSKDVKETLDSFSRLDRLNQVLLGGLLVGQAILKKPLGQALQAQSKAKAPRKKAPANAGSATL